MRSAVLFLPSLMTVLMNLVTSVLLYTGSAASSRFGISRLRGIFDLCIDESTNLPIYKLESLNRSIHIRQLENSQIRKSLFRSLRSVLGTTLLAALDADSVERPAHNVIPDTRKIFHAATANQHQRVLLQVVSHARDIRRHLDPVGEPHTRDLAERRVGLLRCLGEDAHADAALLRADLQGGTLRLGDDLLPSLANELADRGHSAYRRKLALLLLKFPHAAASVTAGASFQA